MASQNRPKTLQKSIPNRCSRASLISYAIVAKTFDIFKRRNLENINFPFRKSMFFKFSRKACLCEFRAFSPSKNHPKTLPKRGPNPSKIDAENVVIFNIDFLRFWPRFGRVLGLQDGAKLAILASKSCHVATFLPS